jgi:hypothetical protein
VDVAHVGGDPAPESDSAAGVTTVGASLTFVELTTEASSSRTQLGATTIEIMPEVDMTTVTSATMAGDGDDDELIVVTGHLVL